jgi:hypothetical protein
VRHGLLVESSARPIASRICGDGWRSRPHIGIGRSRAGTRVLLLVQDLHIRVINADTGELVRDLTLDPDKTYQPTGRPAGWRSRRRD